MSNVSDDVRRTRSGKQLERADSPQALRESAAAKRKNRNKKSKASTPHLTAPLSILTKDMDVPVRDMEAWVNRSIQERLAEAKERKGYITRPMNSFMLYRSAYAERTKAWCAANNHQVVSSVSGVSWPLEPKDIRDFYCELADIERQNHTNAHPDYKFSPAKPGDRKRKGAAQPEDASVADDDPNADWAASHRVRSRQRVERETSHPPRDTAVPEVPPEAALASQSHPYGRQAWSHDPMHALPSPIDQSLISTPGHYYQSALSLGLAHDGDPYHQFGSAEYLQSNGFVGLPGASHHELLQLHGGAYDNGRQVMEAPIDPILMPYESHLPANLANMSSVGLHPGMAYGEDYDIHYAPTPAPYADSEAAGDTYPQQDVKYADDRDWRPTSSGIGLDDVAQFDTYWPEGSDSTGVDRQDDQGLLSTYGEHSEVHQTNAAPEGRRSVVEGDQAAIPAPEDEDDAPLRYDGHALLAPPASAPVGVSHLESMVDPEPQPDVKAARSEDSDKSPKTV
jgi:hypothetical protein